VPGLVLAWLAGESIIIYRSFKNNHRPPMPGQLLASSGLFAALGLLARSPQGTFLAGALGWGFDAAAFMDIAPELLTGGSGATAKKPAAKPAPKGTVKPA
jgi:hypothetical protein